MTPAAKDQGLVELTSAQEVMSLMLSRDPVMKVLRAKRISEAVRCEVAYALIAKSKEAAARIAELEGMLEEARKGLTRIARNKNSPTDQVDVMQSIARSTLSSIQGG